MTAYDRDRILEATDLYALADELLGAHTGARSPSWSCPEPTHRQTGRTPPVSVFVARSGEQRWTCHGCGAAGTAIDLVMRTKGTDFKETLAWLGARAATPTVIDTAPPARRARRLNTSSPGPPNPLLDMYVSACEAQLWAAQGRHARQWLTATRRIPEDILRAHRVGFDPGSHHLDRPDGVPKTGGVVLAILDADRRAIFTQARTLHAQPELSRYLNCAARLAPNPRLGIYQPAHALSENVIVCEGVLDALCAVSAGHRAAAVLGAALPDEKIARRLCALGRPLLIAFDADDAGDRGAERLARHLAALGSHPARRLRPPPQHGDLNAWMSALGGADRWQERFTHVLQRCAERRPPALMRGARGIAGPSR